MKIERFVGALLVSLIVALAVAVGWVSAATEGATASAQAERLPATFDVVDYVNRLSYDYVDGEKQGMLAFTLAAGAWGWDRDKIDAWLPFAKDLISVESGYCPNLFGGATPPAPGAGCHTTRQGSGTDAGFGQLTSVHHGRGRWLCEEYNICGRDAVVRDAWTSMSVVVWLLDREGSQPWCYDARARRLHDCGLAPDR